MIVYLHKCFEEIGIFDSPHITLLFSALFNMNDLKLYHSLFSETLNFTVSYIKVKESLLFSLTLSLFLSRVKRKAQQQYFKHSSLPSICLLLPEGPADYQPLNKAISQGNGEYCT